MWGNSPYYVTKKRRLRPNRYKCIWGREYSSRGGSHALIVRDLTPLLICVETFGVLYLSAQSIGDGYPTQRNSCGREGRRNWRRFYTKNTFVLSNMNYRGHVAHFNDLSQYTAPARGWNSHIKVVLGNVRIHSSAVRGSDFSWLWFPANYRFLWLLRVVDFSANSLFRDRRPIQNPTAETGFR